MLLYEYIVTITTLSSYCIISIIKFITISWLPTFCSTINYHILRKHQPYTVIHYICIYIYTCICIYIYIHIDIWLLIYIYIYTMKPAISSSFPILFHSSHPLAMAIQVPASPSHQWGWRNSCAPRSCEDCARPNGVESIWLPRLGWKSEGWDDESHEKTIYPDHPWCWYIYLHLPHKWPSFVGRYTIHGWSGYMKAVS